jgi:hypothetical protein
VSRTEMVRNRSLPHGARDLQEAQWTTPIRKRLCRRGSENASTNPWRHRNGEARWKGLARLLTLPGSSFYHQR